ESSYKFSLPPMSLFLSPSTVRLQGCLSNIFSFFQKNESLTGEHGHGKQDHPGSDRSMFQSKYQSQDVCPEDQCVHRNGEELPSFYSFDFQSRFLPADNLSNGLRLNRKSLPQDISYKEFLK